eukprot:12445958-Alexandrium_andersonii.AAC.1
MSASLVGSEMCIRDSPSAALAALPFAFPLRPSWLHTPRLRCSRGLPVWPVSYTHLTLPTICSV